MFPLYVEEDFFNSCVIARIVLASHDGCILLILLEILHDLLHSLLDDRIPNEFLLESTLFSCRSSCVQTRYIASNCGLVVHQGLEARLIIP